MCVISYCFSISLISVLRFLVGGFSQTSCCAQTRTILLADTKQPWLFLRATTLRWGLAAGEWILSTSCSWGSGASTNLHLLSHLFLMCFWGLLIGLGWILPQAESSPLRATGSAVKAVVGEGKLSCRSWSISVYWSILGHPMFSLGFLFSPHRKRIPFHAASLHSPELWCWQLHLFCCLLLPTL